MASLKVLLEMGMLPAHWMPTTVLLMEKSPHPHLGTAKGQASRRGNEKTIQTITSLFFIIKKKSWLPGEGQFVQEWHCPHQD